MPFCSSTRIAGAIVGFGALTIASVPAASAPMSLPDPNPRRFADVLLPDPNPARPVIETAADTPPDSQSAPTQRAETTEPAATRDVTTDSVIVVEAPSVPASAQKTEGTPAPAAKPEPILAGPLDVKQDITPLPEATPTTTKLGIARSNETAKSDAVPKQLAADKRPDFDFDKALRPILAYRLSKSDKANLKGTLNAVYRGKISEGDRVRRRIKDKNARKLADWYFLRKSYLGASASQIEAFRTANPYWPGQKLMRRRAEYALFVAKPAPEKVITFFKDQPPQSGEGQVALAGAYLAQGDKARAKEIVVDAWRNYKLDKKSEKLIRARFGDMLTNADHRARIDKLLYADRKSRLARAKRTADIIGKAERKKVDARAAVVRRSRSAGKLLSALPKAVKSEPGVYFSRIQYLRRKKKYDKVWPMWINAPKDPKLIADNNEWWIERRIAVIRALNSGQHKLAYEIAKAHGPLTGKSFLDAKFMTGWIALRFMDDPKAAKVYFEALASKATASRRVARAHYWLGRTEASLGNATEADAHYRKAAEHNTTYYGQVAAQTLSPRPLPLDIKETPNPTPEDVARFQSRDAVLAIGAAKAAGLKRLAPLFFFHLARTVKEPGEIALLAILARRMKMPQASVRLAKIAHFHGVDVATYAFPTDMIPKYKRLNEGIEPALLYALSRQESEFNPKAKSHAGARGLMQIMPRTARAIARSYKVRYRVANLTAKPSYNVMLGAAHLRDLVDGFKGSYIMTLGAYNAGGPRIREWIGKFGDPRTAKKDPVDWVEQIPFSETRNYVLKIMPSIQIYRARLEGNQNALQILQDLSRGRSVPLASTAAMDITGSTTPVKN